MEYIKNFWTVLNNRLWIGIILILGIIAFVLLYISEEQIPNLPLSSGIVAFISAVIGVLLTAFAISVQLSQQSEVEAQKDKDIKIFEQKIRVYAEFTEKMWEMFDGNEITDDDLKELRKICFRKLVFYLNSQQIRQITEQINSIRDKSKGAAGTITNILQNSLKPDQKEKSDQKVKSGDLTKLFDSFDKKEKSEQVVSVIQAQNDNQKQQQVTSEVQFWQFNILNEEKQIKAFKDGNWVLALIEYGEDWRTNLIRQVMPNDVIFLFKRGGAGYIGAFKALDPASKNLESTNYNKDDVKLFDIYGGLDDGADWASNIRVQPIAYNFKGVGYQTVPLKTISRMNNPDRVKFLLNRFNGEDMEWDKNRKDGKGKLDDTTKVDLDESTFSEIIKSFNL